MVIQLPKKGRPLGVPYRECDLGLDLPAEFIGDLRSLDNQLYPIFHPYRILWDDMVNCYTGALEDPRYPMQENCFRYNQLVMGHVLTNGKGVPTPDETWHIWRWCEPARAWAHIVNLDSHDEVYLNILVKRLWLQDKFNSRYGNRGYMKMMEEADLAQRAKIQDDKQNLMKDISKANTAMLSRVRDNYLSGKVDPTSPMRESVISYPGQVNRSKTVRPLSDREGGLILPDGLGEDDA